MKKSNNSKFHIFLDRSVLKMRIRNHCAILVGMFLTSSCAVTSSDSAADDLGYKQWKQIAQDSTSTAPPAPSFPFIQVSSDEEFSDLKNTKKEKLPDFIVNNMVLTRDMDVGILLKTLADAADLNVIISNSISGPVRVSLKREARWDNIFLAIMESRGYHYDLKDGLLSIYSLEDIKVRTALEQALYDQRQVAEMRLRAQPMEVAMIRVNYADIDNLAASISSTMNSVIADRELAGEGVEPVSGTGSFTIKADADTGQLILHGIPPDIAQARRLINGLDQPSYQILIEATIVQASNEIARQLGVQWGVLEQSGIVSIGSPNAEGINANFPAGFNPLDTGFVFGASRTVGSQVLQAQLSALQKDGRLNIISRPSITTLDQLTATIESGEERPFSSGTGTGVAAVSSVEFKKAVLSLEVTPHVIDENWVKLAINTTKDEFDDTRTVIIDGNPQVPILTRSAVTALYLSNGQTTVIGGLSSETEGLQEEGVPVLKNIPGLGTMFRNESGRKSFSDTLIFITPHILPKFGNKVSPAGK